MIRKRSTPTNSWADERIPVQPHRVVEYGLGRGDIDAVRADEIDQRGDIVHGHERLGVNHPMVIWN